MRYRSPSRIQPCGVGPPASHRIPRVLWYSGTSYSLLLFTYAAFTLSGPAFQQCSIKNILCSCWPATPESMLSGLGSFPFARRYSGNRCFFLFLPVLRCFSSRSSLRMSYVFTHGCQVFYLPGFPIRISRDLCLLAAPPCFSQLATSFFGAWCLGIHPVLFFA